MVSGQEATDSAGGDVPQLYEGAGRSPSQVHRGRREGGGEGGESGGSEQAYGQGARPQRYAGPRHESYTQRPLASLNDSWLPSAQMACILNLFRSC